MTGLSVLGDGKRRYTKAELEEFLGTELANVSVCDNPEAQFLARAPIVRLSLDSEPLVIGVVAKGEDSQLEKLMSAINGAGEVNDALMTKRDDLSFLRVSVSPASLADAQSGLKTILSAINLFST